MMMVQRKQGVGSFMVQGVTINGTFRAFPTCCTQYSCNICGGVDPKDLFEKINFRMMDSTAYNFGIDEQVSMDLIMDHIPCRWVIVLHPVLIFNRAIIMSSKISNVTSVKLSCTPKSWWMRPQPTRQSMNNFWTSWCASLAKILTTSHGIMLYSLGHIVAKRNGAVQLRKERFNKFPWLSPHWTIPCSHL